jgi:tripartite ATP-independent transporter DctM subunit
MGELLMRTGLAGKTVEAVDHWIGRIPGRLSLTSVGGGALFGALSGASMASVAMLGSTLVPEMTKRGYKPAMSVSSILAGGGLAVLIPPSALGVLLGASAKVSIAQLLLAGILPGIVLAAMYFVYFSARAALQPDLAPPYQAKSTTIREKLYILLTVAPLLSLIVVVTGLIFLGIATPSESAAMGVVATLALAACYGRLTLHALRTALISTMITTAMMLLVIVGSTGFSQLLAATGSTSMLVSVVGELDLGPIATILIMQLIVLVLGCFIDTISIMLVTIPVFMPIVLMMGIDPIWFCILILVQLELAGITPPFGVLLFVMKGVQQHLKIGEIYRAAIPIVLIQGLLITLLMVFPEIVTILPNMAKT